MKLNDKITLKLLRIMLFFLCWYCESFHNAKCMLKCTHCYLLQFQSVYCNFNDGMKLGFLIGKHECEGKHEKKI